MTIDDILSFRESCIAENPSDEAGRFKQVAELDFFYGCFVYSIEDTITEKTLDISEYIYSLL